MFPFHTPENNRTKDFLVFLGGYKMETLARNGLIEFCAG